MSSRELFNVLRGEMTSMARARSSPTRPPCTDRSSGSVLSVRPGMTGAWQVGGRNNIEYPERVDIDVDYVHRKSTTVDLAILLKTPVALFDWNATS